MNSKQILENYKDIVSEIKGPVTEDDIDVLARRQQVLDKSYRLRTIVDAWKDQQNQDRSLRRIYAKTLLWILGIETSVSVVAFFLMGFSVLHVEVWVANMFFFAVFGKAATMVFAIVKYLFPQTNLEFLKLLERL